MAHFQRFSLQLCRVVPRDLLSADSQIQQLCAAGDGSVAVYDWRAASVTLSGWREFEPDTRWCDEARTTSVREAYILQSKHVV